MLQFPAWKVALIAITILWGAMLALPNMLSEGQREMIPGPLPSSPAKLGLDLQGGVSLLLSVDSDKSVNKQLNDLLRDVRSRLQSTRGDDRIAYSGLRVESNAVRFKPRAQDMIDPAVELLCGLNTTLGGPLASPSIRVAQIAGGEVEVRFTPQRIETIRNDATRQTIAKLGPRLDPNGIGEISVQAQGETDIIVEAPGESDPERLKRIIEQPGELTFNLVEDNPTIVNEAFRTGRVRAGYQMIDSVTGEQLLVEANPIIEGDMVRSASQGFHPENNTPIVNFTFNTRGAKLFGDATAANRGKRFAIILDGVSQSAPRINAAILGGSGFIEGSFTVDSAKELATIIQAGALPADVRVESERLVGPTLGQDSIEAGTMASLIGLVLVAIFMVIAYGLFGGFAVGSLFANIILIFGLLSGLGATLTLPGIAGIILTIGMAVDANVLVFERIREEQKNGRSPLSAVESGYKQAFSTILDANITTLLAAITLYLLGSGPVKGFAVTLAIGIFTSVFTAFVVTRWFTVSWLRMARPKKLPI
ncbi:MAG: protein translocase subunit SecD [Ponticaulis sp.]|nr:protein translocase subunit SecD [Ponticaulis sp.]|tara:strand:+ start:9212 stop:10819 length:1608 start_codon:yes stop_codon:yes gene_type:complete